MFPVNEASKQNEESYYVKEMIIIKNFYKKTNLFKNKILTSPTDNVVIYSINSY